MAGVKQGFDLREENTHKRRLSLGRSSSEFLEAEAIVFWHRIPPLCAVHIAAAHQPKIFEGDGQHKSTQVNVGM